MSERMRVGAQQEQLQRLAEGITGHLRLTLEELVRIRGAVQVLLEAVEQQEKRPSRADLGGIRDELQACLRRSNHPMDGIGVAAAVDYLEDSPYWLEWWRYDGRGELEFVAHSLNPQRDAFYDYSARGWFSVPATSGSLVVAGPYVDIGGTNAYTVTVSVPVFTSAGFAGVAGADILAARFERFLLQTDRGEAPVVLANADLRVIASNTARHLPGDLLREGEVAGWTRLELLGDPFPEGKAWQLLSPAS